MVGLAKWWRARREKHRQELIRREQLKRGVDELVDIVDPRLRGLANYRSKLEPALQNATAVAEELIAALPPPISVGEKLWSTEPHLRAMFASADEMQAFFDNDRGLKRFLTSSESLGASKVYAALGMQMNKEIRLGAEIQGEVLRRDRKQNFITFSGHRLGVVASSEDELRKQMRRRVLEEIATRAMQRIMGFQTRKDILSEEKATLSWKLKIYEKRRNGVGALWHQEESYDRHIQRLRKDLNATEAGIHNLMEQAGNIEDYLDATVDELNIMGETIRLEPVTVVLNSMNQEVNAEEGGNEISLFQAKFGRRRPRVIQLVSFSPDFVRVDVGSSLRRAARALGVRAALR